MRRSQGITQAILPPRCSSSRSARPRTIMRAWLLDPTRERLARCPWSEGSDAYRAYHDNEWGVPVHDDRVFFEFLVLEGAQAGLAWSTILNKRAGYRAAFANFDPVESCRVSAMRTSNASWSIRRSFAIGARSKARSATLAHSWRSSAASEASTATSGSSWAARRASIASGRSAAVPARTAQSDALSKDLITARISLRRLDDRLRVHAGDRTGQRPPRPLPALGGARRRSLEAGASIVNSPARRASSSGACDTPRK